MAAAKSPAKKPSKLASLKSLLLGSNAGKKGAPAAAKPGKAAAGKAPAPAASAAKPARQGKVAAPAKAAPAKGAKAPAPAVAPSKTPAAKQAKGKAAPAPAPAKAPAGKQAKGAEPAAAKGAARPARQSRASASLRAEASSEAVCREVACDGLATSAGYCRLHYIKNWKKIQRKAIILKEGKLNQYIEELVAKYPDKYIEAIRQDLANDKDFAKVIYDLDLDETIDEFDMEGENVEGLVDNIKPSFEDEGESGF